MKSICITFDVDFTDYVDSGQRDEFEQGFTDISAVLNRFPYVQTTWFVRLDRQIGATFGTPDFAFRRHAQSMEWLREHGHEIAWHHHAYKQSGDQWEAESDATAFAASIRKYGELAREQGLSSARMGWGQQTTAGIDILEELGFSVDSSAIPRPNYAWNQIPLRDWSLTGQLPFFPSRSDHRIQAESTRKLLEIPISTVPLPLTSDTAAGVIRYLNPAYHPDLFRTAVERCGNQLVVSIGHPYEFVARSTAHNALAFDISALQDNLNYLVDAGFRFETLSMASKRYCNTAVSAPN